ncbi:MAG: M28 family peptidase [Pseudomonadota bacterium]
MTKTQQAQARRPAEGLIALVSLVFAIFLCGPWLINAPAVDADHLFDTAATMERLARILGDEAPHPVDSDASDGVIERLTAEIAALGFEPIVDEAFHCNDRWGLTCAQVHNVGFWVTEPGQDAVMIASHHDSVPTGPGAADDGMGASASIEIARIMRGRDLPRPLYVLITDAEEIGLVGASRFVGHDPVAPLIGAVVSLEARGNRGAASMFETSDPNSRDLAALRPHPERRARGPVSNSLSVDIYRAMPNGTDVTEYLTLGMDAANLAMTGHYSHYHTRHDTLENLSEEAVFHIGASALSAVEGFMTVGSETPETNKIYGDVLGVFVLAIPEGWGLPLIILTILACGVALFRVEREGAPLWRVGLMPLLILVGGTGLAFLANMGVDAIRPESAYGRAYPIALRGLFMSLALLVAILAARWLYRPASANRYLVGSWAVLMGMGLAASLVFSGAMVLFALPAMLVLPAAILMIAKQAALSRILFAFAAILTLTQLVSLHVGAETALFVETSAPLTALALWIFLISLPLFWTRDGSTRRGVIGAGAAVAGFGLAALLIPAYSAESPLGANLYHVKSSGEDQAYIALSARDPIPDSLTELAPFAIGEVSNFSSRVWITPVSPPDMQSATLYIEENQVEAGERRVRFRIDAPDADHLQLIAPDPAPDISTVSVNGFDVEADGWRFPRIECHGRTCRDFVIEMTLLETEELVSFALWTNQWGLGPIGQPFDDARPDWTGPQHDGDRRMVRYEFGIPAPDTPIDPPAVEPTE